MRGGAPNKIIICCLVAIIVLLAASTTWLVYALASGILSDGIFSLTRQNWWFTYENVQTPGEGAGVVLIACAGIAGLLLFVLFGTIFLNFQFKKTGAPELFFFMLFLTALSIEAFRIASLAVQVFNLPSIFHTIITKIVYFGRFASILFLLLGSLYGCEIRYPKFIHLAGIALVVPFTLSYLISLDSTLFLNTFLLKLNDEFGILLINFSIGFFSVINYIIAAFKRNVRFVFIALACFLFLGCKEVVYFSENPLLLLAAILSLGLASVMVYREIDRIYLFA